MTENIVIYTDGACLGNPGSGGWAAVLIYKDIKKEISGGEKLTTNNRMELMATIMALKELKEPNKSVVIYTDSMYVKNGISDWIIKWKRNGWKASSGPVKNVDLWQELDILNLQFKVEWRWVRGHSGNMYNEIVDKLARKQAELFSL